MVSRSASPPGDLTYDDLDVQLVGGNVNFGESDSVILRRQIEPVGGSLSRGEAAELVGIKNGGIFLYLASGSNIDEAHGRYQLGTSPTLDTYQQAFNVGDSSTDFEIVDTENGNVTASSLGGNSVEDLNNEVWYYSSPHQYGPVVDKTNGAAGVGSLHMDHHDVHFRDVAQQGPVLDRHHDIYEVVNMESQQAGSSVSLYRNLLLYWNVSDAEDFD